MVRQLPRPFPTAWCRRGLAATGIGWPVAHCRHWRARLAGRSAFRWWASRCHPL